MFTQEEREVIIAQKQIWNFDFERDLACQKNWSWQEVDVLVKKYKFEYMSEDESEELELEIFRANFYWLLDIAKKNTYIVQGYNSDDIYTCMFLAHRNLLEQFKIIKFDTDDEKVKNSQSQISFRYFLKKYFASRFHRFFIEGTKDFKGNDGGWNRANGKISAVSYDTDEGLDIEDSTVTTEINKIEVSDMDIKEEIKKELRRVLTKDESDCVMLYFGLLKRNKVTAHLSKTEIKKTAQEVVVKLKDNERLRELFDYYNQHLAK